MKLLPNITKLSKNIITEINKLYLAKYRKEKGTFIALGPHLYKEAKLARVLVTAYATIDTVDATYISEEDMKKIAKTDTPCQVLSICKVVDKHELSNKVLLLDAIQDPGNMGTLMRTAKAFGFDTIVLGNGCVDIYNDKVVRASQGAIFKLNYIHMPIKEFISQNNNYQMYGTSVNNGVTPNLIQFVPPLGLILGNEGNGINPEILALTKQNLYIPMTNTESLNVSVAGAILMYLMQ